MSITVLCGIQYGDEGKGKLIDYLAKDFDVVARFNGSCNAGHSVWVDGKKYVFHLIPSGILYPDKICIIGNGVVVNLEELTKELDYIKSLGLSMKGRLFISNRAFVVDGKHIEEDSVRFQKHLGTTGKGVGPAYAAKIARTSYSLKDIPRKSKYYDLISPYLTDTASLINKCIDDGKSILCEAAQGIMLDVDHGMYPFVTSCNTTAATACNGLGFSPMKIDRIVGISKVYSTRVGTGPFPTEVFDTAGEKLRTIGKEFGATTGRPRRCGWLDLPMFRYANMINGTTELAITKLDILDTFETIQVATEYELNGMNIANPSLEQMIEGKPIYKSFSGWMKDTTKLTTKEELPEEMKILLNFIQDAVKVPIKYISNGAERNSIIRY